MSDVQESARPLIPPLLYVPVRDYLPGAGEVPIDFRSLPDGRTALVAYTALDRLVAACGAEQPWVVLPTDRLSEVDQHSPYEVMLLDVAIAAGARDGADS